MLVLSRKRNESIIINDDITITIVDIRGENVRLGIEAPKETPVHRREVYEAIYKNESHPRTPVDTNAHLTTELVKLQNQHTQLKNHNNNLVQHSAELQQEITKLQQEVTKLRSLDTETLKLQNQQLQIELTKLQDHCYNITNQLQDELNAHQHPPVEAEAPTITQQYIDFQERIKELGTDNHSLISRNTHLEEKLESFQETINKLHTDYQITIANLHNEIDNLQNDASTTERVITNLQDEICDLTDCREHLRQLGQKLCGCDHVENADERTEQTRHILEIIRKLTNTNLDYQQEITKLQKEIASLEDDIIAESTILFCEKHQIIHTDTQGCYLCDVENKNLRAKPTI